ncbi:MAG: hypothetical protein FJ100_07900 [Deltaproteobacteria bacterium]|nr:hypothetical protein [Deltaproteobacteria bacterium]
MRKSDPGDRRRFSPRLVPTLAMVAMLPLLLYLGTWQARRYLDSAARVQAYHRQHDELPPLQSLDVQGDRNAALHFRRVTLAGKVDVAQAQLLTARYKFGQRGYSVVAPFEVASGPHAKVLVLLGWVPEAHIDDWLGQLAADPPRQVRGRAQFVNMLNSQETQVNQRGQRAVWMFPNPRAMAARIAGLDPDLLIESGDQSSGAFMDPTKWPVQGYEFPVRPLPIKHVEYSATWYGLAATLVGVWIALSLRRRDQGAG